MTGNHLDLNKLNLWDLHVTSVRFFQAPDTGPPTYNLEIEVNIRPGTLAPDSPGSTASFRFCDCCEFGAGVDVRMWAMVGPELAEGHAVPVEGHSSLTRYTLDLRAPGGTIEIVARSFIYKGPDITKITAIPSESMNWSWNDLQDRKRK